MHTLQFGKYYWSLKDIVSHVYFSFEISLNTINRFMNFRLMKGLRPFLDVPRLKEVNYGNEISYSKKCPTRLDLHTITWLSWTFRLCSELFVYVCAIVCAGCFPCVHVQTLIFTFTWRIF